jgi:hypothetical protein
METLLLQWPDEFALASIPCRLQAGRKVASSVRICPVFKDSFTLLHRDSSDLPKSNPDVEVTAFSVHKRRTVSTFQFLSLHKFVMPEIPGAIFLQNT